MDEEVLQDLYDRAVSLGYKKSKEEFVNLLKSDSSVQDDNYEYVKAQGYQKSINDFLGLVGAGQVKKKEQFDTTVSPSGASSSASQSRANIAGAGKSYQDELLGKNFVQRMYNPEKSIANPDGSFSTHKMASAEVDGKYIAFPTIVEKDGQLVELPVNEAIDFALANNEYAQFGAEKDAQWWASGGYKKGTPLEEGAPQKKQQQKVEAPTVDKMIESITPELIGKNEEFVVPKMNYQFGPMGFKFDESGATGDWMTVTAPNGNQMEVSLDISWYSPGNESEEVEKLKTFMRENSKATGLAALEQEYKKRDKIFTTDKDVEDALISFNTQAETFKNDANIFLDERKNLEAQLAQLNARKDKNSPEFKQLYNDAIGKKANLEKKQKELEARQTMLDSKNTILKRSMGAYDEMKKQQGTWTGATLDWLSEGFAGISASTVSNTIDLMLSKYVAGADEDELSQQVTDNKATGNAEQDAKDNVAVSNAYRINEIRNKAIAEQAAQGNTKTVPIGTPDAIPMPAAGQSYKDWWNSLSPDQKTTIVDKSNDDVKKELKKNLLPAIREGNEIVWGDDDTTVEFRKLKEEGFWGGAYAGVVKSLPAMIGSNNPMGWAQRTAQMYAQTTDAVNQEMEKNPAFDDISESEKQMVVMPIGIASAALESIGLSNIIANKGLMNRVILGAMGKAGATTTAKTFGELVKNEVNSMAARGALTLAGAALAEAETGAAQQIVDYAVKDIYEAAKQKDLFQNPDFLTADYVKDIAKAGAQEAVGGFILGVPSAISAAYTKKGYLSMNDNVFKTFESYANDDRLQSAFITELKGKVASGLITTTEGKEMLNNYRNSVGLFRQLPDGLNTQSKKEAMNLLKERRDLEQQIEGKEGSLVQKQKDRIAEITTELQELPNKQAQQAREESNRTGRTIIDGTRIQVAPPERRTEVLNNRETLTEALRNLDDQQAESFGFVDENGDTLDLRDNEDRIAQEYFDSIGAQNNSNPLTQPQMSAKTIVDKLFGEGSMTITDASWANDLDDNTEYELNFQSQYQIPWTFSDRISENNDGTYTVKANGFDIKNEFKRDLVDSFNNDQMYTFDFNSMEEVPDEYRDDVREIPAIEAQRKFLGVIPMGKSKVVRDKIYRVSITGADAKKLKLQPQRAANKAQVFRNTAKSLASIFPDLKIVSVANENEMRDYALQNFNQDVADTITGAEGGAIINDASGNPIAILINEETAIATTMPHEAWHAILVKAFGENPALFEEFKNGIEKALRDNGMTQIIDALDNFSNQEEYINSNMQAEEWLVELGGLLTSSGITYDNLTPKAKSLLTQIKAVFNAIAVKITGQPMFLEDATPEDMLDFMVTISDRMARGMSLNEFFRDTAPTGPAGPGVSSKTQAKKQVPIEEVNRAKVREYNQKAKENRGENIKTKGFKTVKKRGQDLKIGDIYSRKINDAVYVFKVLSDLRKSYGQFYTMDVEVLDTGTDYVRQELAPNFEIREVGKKVGEKTIDSFKNLSSPLGFNFGEVTVLQDYEAKSKEEPTQKVKSQRPTGDSATLAEVKKIALRYNMNDRGFMPKTASEVVLARELAPYGYGAKRSKITPEGYGGTVYMTNAAGKFFNPFTVKKHRISLSGGKLNPNVNTIEGYDRMMDQVQTIIDKSERRGVAKDKIMQNVMEYVTKSKVYERANDSQREQLVRNVETEFGKAQKSSPSVGKILGTLKDIKKITLTEKELLKQHFRDLAKGARDAKRAFMQASDDLSLAVSELAKSGKILPKQLSDVIRKFSKVNMLNEDSTNAFVDYMTKVFEDADYAEKIAGIRTKITKARGNLKSKIGVADAIANPMRKLLAVNPTLIPDDVFDKYLNIVNMFSASQAVLPLKDINEISQDINDIFQSLDEQLSKSEELAIRFDDFADKVVNEENGKIQYADTINKMEKDGIITAEEAELMKKYKSVIFSTEKKGGKTPAEIQAENNVLIKAITDAKINLDSLTLKDERELADNIRRLLKPELLKQLTTAQLTNLIKLIDNINNGFMPHYGMLAFERLNAIKNATPVGEATLAAKPLPVTQVYNNLKSKFTKKGGILEMVRSGGFFFIDQVFGNFKTKPIFNALFEKISEAQSAFTSALGQVNKKLDAAHDAVAKSFSYDANKTLESSFRMMAYMIQLEYDSNPGNKQVNPASAYIKETIKAIKRGKTKYGDAEIEMLQRILDKDGNVDKDALYNSFNNAEKNAIKTIREINDGLTEKAVYTAAVIRGQRIDALNNYVHLPVMSEYNPDESAVATQVANNYNNNLNPSTKGKNLIERTAGAKAINFDVFASAQRGAKFTLLDYHMTTPIRTARKTLNEVENRYGDEFTKQQREIFNAIRDGFEEVVSDVLTNNFVATSTADEVVNFISKQGYRVVLGSAFRFVAELKSNLAFVTFAGRKAFAEGVKYFPIISSPDAVSIMDNVRSKQTTRLYHGDTLSGRFIDQSVLSQTSGVKSTTAKNVIANKANQIYNMSLKKYKNSVELIADTLISTPDRVIMRPVWFGQFATEFKKQTGKDVDFKKIADNNEAYMRENKDAIEAAKLRADEMSVLAGATDNPFMGMVKGSTKPNQSVLLRAFNNFNTYMTRFAMYEYTTARQGIYAAMGKGSITRKEGIGLLAAVTARMTVYTLLTNMFAGGLAGLLGDEEEEDEKTLMQKLGQSFASTGSSLLLGRNFGNATKMLVNYGVEEVNEEFLDFLRNGDYDPYKDAISFSAIPKEKKAGETNIADFIGNMSGSFSPAMKTTNLIIKKAFAKEKKEPEAIKRSEEENMIRIPLEVLGNMGMVPLYKDVRREVMNELYKDLRTADKRAEDKKQAEKEMLHGYENKEDMKRYDPELYDEVFGKDSPGYDAAQAKKKLKHEADSIERRMKDEFYEYVPKKKGGFGSGSGFGSESKKKGGFGSGSGFGSKSGFGGK